MIKIKYLLALLKSGFCLRFLGVCALSLTTSAHANTQIFTTGSVHENIGIYFGVDYVEYTKPVVIDFRTMQSESGWMALLSNFYYSIHKNDKKLFVSLHSANGDSREKAAQLADKAYSFEPGVEIKHIELKGMFRMGKLYIPILSGEFTPIRAASAPLIACENDVCHLELRSGRNPSLGELYSLIEGRYSKHLRKLSQLELDEFARVKGDFQKYKMLPGSVNHRTPGQPELYPTFYLNYQSYPSDSKIPINLASGDSTNTGLKEFVPVVKLFRELRELDSTQAQGEDLVESMFIQAFQNERMKHARLPLFFPHGGGIDNREVNPWRYTQLVRQWSAIVPAGYLNHGDLRILYFIPTTESEPLDQQGRGIVQMFPVSRSSNEFVLSLDGLPVATPELRPLQYPEAITLLMQFFYSDKPKLTTEHNPLKSDQALESSNRNSEAQRPPASSGLLKHSWVLILLVLTASIIAYYFVFKKNK